MKNPAESTINWKAAYRSKSFAKAKGNRLKIVLPLISVFTLLFVGLFTLQSYLKDIGQIPVIGYVDLGFLIVMSLFPLTGLLGIIFTKYTEKYVYPYEDEVIAEFAPKKQALGVIEKAKSPDTEKVILAINH